MPTGHCTSSPDALCVADFHVSSPAVCGRAGSVWLICTSRLRNLEGLEDDVVGAALGRCRRTEASRSEELTIKGYMITQIENLDSAWFATKGPAKMGQTKRCC